MSGEFALMIGKAVVFIGALLELRHLIAAISKHFSGCYDVRSTILRAAQLDDATAVGLIVCGLLAVAIAITVYREFRHRVTR